jgi:hypothetical protein
MLQDIVDVGEWELIEQAVDRFNQTTHHEPAEGGANVTSWHSGWYFVEYDGTVTEFTGGRINYWWILLK